MWEALGRSGGQKGFLVMGREVFGDGREVWRAGEVFQGGEGGGVRCGEAMFVHGGQEGAYFAC